MAGTNYHYELRRGDQIIATGRLTWDHQLDVGDEMTIGRHRGLVQAIQPLLASRDYRLVVQLRPTPAPER
jgi:hypothetical protein